MHFMHSRCFLFLEGCFDYFPQWLNTFTFKESIYIMLSLFLIQVDFEVKIFALYTEAFWSLSSSPYKVFPHWWPNYFSTKLNLIWSFWHFTFTFTCDSRKRVPLHFPFSILSFTKDAGFSLHAHGCFMNLINFKGNNTLVDMS